MFSFCPHCGQSLEQDQSEGQMLVCGHCRKSIGMVAAAPKPVVVDGNQEAIRRGTAARCPACDQVVEIRTSGTFAPHYPEAGPRKICGNSGKPVPARQVEAPVVGTPLRRPATSKDLSAYMNRDLIKVISCRAQSDPQVEELTLEYLDRNDRVRIQIEALRDILGPRFAMRAYPAGLNRPELAVWASADGYVVARKDPLGGYQSMSDAKLMLIVAELRVHRQMFAAVAAP